jgi:hypothetical protein
MSHRLQTTAFATVLLVVVLGLANSASAQLVALRHHSTILGDHFSGASELVRARGAFLVDEAAAAESWVRTAAAADDLQYQRTEHHYQVKKMRIEYLQQKAEANRQRQQAEMAANEAAALRLLQSAKLGAPQWPSALKNAKYIDSMTMIESLLRNWSPEDTTGEAYRRALATEAGVLRTRVAKDLSIDHPSRVKAVETLSRLQLLATMPAVDGSVQLASR